MFDVHPLEDLFVNLHSTPLVPEEFVITLVSFANLLHPLHSLGIDEFSFSQKHASFQLLFHCHGRLSFHFHGVHSGVRQWNVNELCVCNPDE